MILAVHYSIFNIELGYLFQDKELDLMAGKSILPSISEDDEEKGSEDDDKSPVCTSPRSPLHIPTRFGNRFNFPK